MEREDSKDSREDSEEHDTKDPKRKKKTPLQIEMLERAYAEDTHPSESLRLELSTKLGLTNRQLQMWFCNRRLKDRKGIKDEFNTSTSQSKEEQFFFPKETPTFYEYPEAVLASEIEDDALFRRNVRQQVAQESEERISEVGRKRSKHEIDGAKLSKKTSQQTVSDLDSRAAAISILSSWGETFREDGPTLGFEFDPLPPGAFGMPIEPGRYSNSIATLEHYDAMNIVKQDGNPAKSVAGAKAICSSLKPTFMNVPRDKQLVELARVQELPHRSGGLPKVRKINSLAPQHVQHAARMTSGHQIELDDVQYVQGVLKRPSTVVPASRQTLRPPKRLLSPSIKTYMKQDGYGFEGRLKNGGELSFFPPKNGKANSNESIVSFIKQHEVPAYVKQGKKYFGGEEVVNCNGQDRYWEYDGSDDFQSSEDSDGERNMVEAAKRFRIDQVRQKGKVDMREDYSYELYKVKGHGYNKRSSEETDESTGLIETDKEETDEFQSS